MSDTNIVSLNSENYEDEVILAAEPVLVDFWAPWCAPCRALAPVIAELADDYAGKAKVCKLNVDDFGALAALHNVMSIPTVLLFSEGNELSRLVGVKPKEAYAELLKGLV
ncbi:MAG: thioredoxin [Oscillospiraceae bacterium]|jgi:thioredoxin 1|nr:thioredoxin [Oscillospiraceae bacterium]